VTLLDPFEFVKKDIKHISDMHQLPIEIPDEIPDRLPRYVSSSSRQMEPDDLSFESLHTFFSQNQDPYTYTKEIHLFQKYQEAGMYAFVSWNWVEPFAEWIGNRRVLDVMAGRGWLTYALRQKGINVVATDDFSWGHPSSALTDVLVMDALQAVESFGASTDLLIISWPPMDNVAAKIIKRLYEINPDCLVLYIGESGGGCTADQAFEDTFGLILDEAFSEKVASRYETWQPLHDGLYLGKYYGNPSSS
jgi:hypothetical protein